MTAIANKPTTTPHSYRIGWRQEDYLVRLSPFDWSLTEVDRIRHQGREMRYAHRVIPRWDCDQGTGDEQ